MLDRKGERLDAQEIGIVQQAVEIDTQGMGRELGVQASAQALKRVGVVGLKMELLGQLADDGFNDLAARRVSDCGAARSTDGGRFEQAGSLPAAR